jgi:Cu-Zn family superoxide dismutase
MYVQKQVPGFHGLHIHTVGLCTPPEFNAAGAHWNPKQKLHGRDNLKGAHAGDIENIQVEIDGIGRLHG